MDSTLTTAVCETVTPALAQDTAKSRLVLNSELCFHSQPNGIFMKQVLEIIKRFSYTKTVITNQEANIKL